MKLDVYQHNGSPAGRKIALDAAVFGIDPNDHVLWLDVRRTQAAARQGTHKTKERGEVKGSTRKLYRQKGTGMARAGNAASPLRRGGGRIFGPRPHRYNVRLSKKVRRNARCSALTYKAREDAIRVVDPLNYESPNTRALLTLLGNLELEGQPVLIVTASNRPELFRSSRNLDRVVVREARNVSTEDILRARILVCEEDALAVWSNLWASTLSN
ncbi:MAG: 50S ribosomal protein L4 [Rhodothermaceae bacterium]|nr:50S ribosomal protein L4 [Bacteroidota bacterium]MXW15033.1 50S ribosomal protein L4 [Rhodothermaceae bacterium]MCY3628635.1 50S ribosomal protein L4 [Bacteroidota bacterium]MDE2646088.1 50S ribosomal protein L4 [Bacteroidota bacterium]MXW32706.1 50S ribosomal protein L4 [Rhodothermaceae bacterium]